MINKQEVLELTQKFYNNKGIYLNNDGVIGIDTKETIHITKNKIFFCYEDIVYKECNNIIELKDYYNVLTIEDIYKWLIEEKGFKKEPFCTLIEFSNSDTLIEILEKNKEELPFFMELYFYQKGDFEVILNDLIIGNTSFQNKTPIQIYNIINNILE